MTPRRPTRRTRGGIISISGSHVKLLLFGFAALALGASQGRGPALQTGIVVYQDANYDGRTQTFTSDVPNLEASGLNDQVSSLIVAPGETWEVCVDAGFRGRCATITDRQANLENSGWNDRISSMRRLRTARGFPGGNAQVNPTLELFAGTNYSGQRKVIDDAVDDLDDIDFNDRAISLRVRGIWEVCVNADFDDCRVVSDNVADLAPLGLSRLISSARPRFAARGSGRANQAPNRGIVLYAGRNFTGESIAVTQARATLGDFNDEAQSVRVLSGQWELCDSTNYRGACRVLTADVRDLRTFDLAGVIRSVRPR